MVNFRDTPTAEKKLQRRSEEKIKREKTRLMGKLRSDSALRPRGFRTVGSEIKTRSGHHQPAASALILDHCSPVTITAKNTVGPFLLLKSADIVMHGLFQAFQAFRPNLILGNDRDPFRLHSDNNSIAICWSESSQSGSL